MLDDGERHKCAGCKKKIAYADIWAFTDDKPFCSVRCYMGYIKEARPKDYNDLSLVLGAVE
jgi:hypothetical protein